MNILQAISFIDDIINDHTRLKIWVEKLPNSDIKECLEFDLKCLEEDQLNLYRLLKEELLKGSDS